MENNTLILLVSGSTGNPLLSSFQHFDIFWIMLQLEFWGGDPKLQETSETTIDDLLWALQKAEETPEAAYSLVLGLW